MEIGEAVIEPAPSGRGRDGDIDIEIGRAGIIERWGSRDFAVHEDGTADYTVKRGDTLWEISKDVLRERHKDEPGYRPTREEIEQQVDEIARHNHIEDPDRIDVGQRLEIPRAGEAGVYRDADGRVTRVEYPNGRPARSIEYDDSGNPTRIASDDGREWRKGADGWKEYDPDGEEIGSADNVSVNEHGDITLQSPESEVTIYHNGREGMVVRDSEGHPTEVHYPDGRPSNTIRYEGGQPVEIRSEGGNVWRKEGDRWNHYNADGENVGTADSVEVTPEGDITWKSNDGQEVVLRHDGSSALDERGIERDAQGRVTDVTYPDGTSRHIRYEGNNPVEVQGPDGTWKKEADGWNRYDENGNKTSHADDIRVNSEGDVEVRAGDVAAIHHPDGSTTDVSSDGSKVTRDDDGRVTRVEYPNGRPASSIEYDHSGNPTRIRGSDNFEWRKEGDVWKHYDADGQEIGTANSVDVSEDGEISIKSAEAEITIYRNGEGAMVLKDSEGRPTDVYYPNGRASNTITYDGGQPVEIRSDDGTVWKREGDGWKHYTASGEEAGTARSIEVAENGDITIRSEGDDHITIHHDGTTSGRMGNLAHDSQGRVTEVHYPDGTSRSIAYDAEGNPAELRRSDGTVWRKEEDGWNRYDANGNKDSHFDGNVTVDEDGDVSFMDSDGNGIIRHADGGYTELLADGSAVWYDANGRPEQVDYPNGRPSHAIKYDDSGNPVEIKSGMDGNVWKKEGDSWKQYNHAGEVVGEARDVTVEPSGDIVIHHNDGTDVTYFRDGEATTVFRNADGRPREIWYGNGRASASIEYDAGGNPVAIRSEGDGVWKKENGVWNRYSDSGEFMGYVDEINVAPNGEIKMKTREGMEIVIHPSGDTTSNLPTQPSTTASAR